MSETSDEKAHGKLRRELVVMAALLVAISGVGWYVNGQLTQTICEGQNEIRGLLREAIDDDISDTKASDPSLFPDIPRQQFQMLVDQRVRDLEERKAELADVDC